MSPQMTLKEVVDTMRSAGFKTSEIRIADGIEAGRYPFGDILSTSGTGRRRFEILRVDFEKWLASVTL